MVVTDAVRHVVHPVERPRSPHSVGRALNLECLQLLRDGVRLLVVDPRWLLNDVSSRAGVGQSPLVHVPVVRVSRLQLQVISASRLGSCLELRDLTLRTEDGWKVNIY